MIFKLFNYLYKKDFYFLYVPLYTLYKFITEYKEIQLLRRYIKENDVVVDAGANIGFYSLIFSKLVGKNGLVICFEPDLKNFNLLVKRTKKYPNILCINAALSEYSGNLDFYLSEDLNVDHRSYPINESREKISVKSYSLDEFLKERDLFKVNFIKTDLQGYDPIAIRGMKQTIQNNPDIKIYCEFWPYGMKQAGIHPQNWLEEMKEMGLQTNFLWNNSQKKTLL